MKWNAKLMLYCTWVLLVKMKNIIPKKIYLMVDIWKTWQLLSNRNNQLKCGDNSLLFLMHVDDNEQKKTPFLLSINILLINFARKIFRKSEIFWNTEMINWQISEKKVLNFIFFALFNILTMKMIFYYKIVFRV